MRPSGCSALSIRSQKFNGGRISFPLPGEGGGFMNPASLDERIGEESGLFAAGTSCRVVFRMFNKIRRGIPPLSQQYFAEEYLIRAQPDTVLGRTKSAAPLRRRAQRQAAEPNLQTHAPSFSSRPQIFPGLKIHDASAVHRFLRLQAHLHRPPLSPACRGKRRYHNSPGTQPPPSTRNLKFSPAYC